MAANYHQWTGFWAEQSKLPFSLKSASQDQKDNVILLQTFGLSHACSKCYSKNKELALPLLLKKLLPGGPHHAWSVRTAAPCVCNAGLCHKRPHHTSKRELLDPARRNLRPFTSLLTPQVPKKFRRTHWNVPSESRGVLACSYHKLRVVPRTTYWFACQAKLGAFLANHVAANAELELP